MRATDGLRKENMGKNKYLKIIKQLAQEATETRNSLKDWKNYSNQLLKEKNDLSLNYNSAANDRDKFKLQRDELSEKVKQLESDLEDLNV